RGVDAALDGLCLEELLIDRPARYTIGCRHGRVLGDMTVDLSEQLPGPIFIGAARISSISRDTPTDAIGYFLVNIRRFDAGPQVRCTAANRIAAPIALRC